MADSIRLERGSQSAVVSTAGGRVTGYRVSHVEVLAGQEHPDLFAYRGSLLAPWPNRVTDGRWTWRGEQLQLPLNDPTGVDAALHGLVVDVPFDVTGSTDCSVDLRHQLEPSPGYPFPLRIDVAYALTDTGLDCSLVATNIGDKDAPVGLGVHPYIAAPALVDDVSLMLPAATVLVTDEHWQEVARRPVDGTALDFRDGRRLGALDLDAGFTDLTRREGGRIEVVVSRSDAREVVLSSGTTCRWLLVYSAHTLPADDRRRSIAIEPMTCPPNALATGEIDVLRPGGALSLEWGFTLR